MLRYIESTVYRAVIENLACEMAARMVAMKSNDFALKQFALDGLGLALFPRFFVERELASGKLVQPIPDHAPPELSINAVYETRRHLLPKLQAFLGFLKERFEAESAA